MLLMSFPLFGGQFQWGRDRPKEEEVVAKIIHDRCDRLLKQTNPAGGSGTERVLFNIRLERFYAARGFQPVWTKRKMVAELVEAVEESAYDGLNPSDYHLHKIREYYTNPPASPELEAQYDLFFSKAFLILASHLRYGKVRPASLEPGLNINGDKSLSALDARLQRAIESEKIAVVLKALHPQDANYDLLKKGLVRYQAIAGNGGWPVLASGSMLREGDRDRRIPALRHRLKVSGDIPVQNADTSSVYSREMVEAVKRFQQRNGVDVDGSVGAITLRVMNIPVERRIEQIRLNLERYRWFSGGLDSSCILVNIADYSLQYIENGEYRWKTRVIVGQPLRETPVFKANMQYIVFNPKWVVPATILAKDVLPAINNDSSYLDKKKLKVITPEGITINPASVDWSHYSAENLPYRLQQRSGDQGALGRIKFMMPNRYTVYLHDTSSKELFEKSRRAFSSGCVRVQYPEELARLLLQDTILWSRAKIQDAINTGKTRTVNLPQQIPVFLLYLTVIPKGEEIQFRDDIYNHDDKLLKALNKPIPQQ